MVEPLFTVCHDRDRGSHDTTCTGKSWQDQAPVLAPLAVLVCSALLVLSQLYLAIPLAPVIAEVLGRGGSATAAALGTTYALAYGLGFLIFRTTVDPLRP